MPAQGSNGGPGSGRLTGVLMANDVFVVLTMDREPALSECSPLAMRLLGTGPADYADPEHPSSVNLRVILSTLREKSDAPGLCPVGTTVTTSCG